MVATLTLVADTITPVRAYASLRSAAGNAASFLLESVTAGERWGRYSILGYCPKREMTLQANGHWVGADGRPLSVLAGQDPLSAVQSMFATDGDRSTPVDGPAARFARTYVGYFRQSR